MTPTLEQTHIAIIGLGYVGLPLAVEFGKQFSTLGFDINPQRIAQLRNGQDRTLETTPEELAQASRLQFTTDPAALAACNVFIVTVPTPIDKANRPDLRNTKVVDIVSALQSYNPQVDVYDPWIDVADAKLEHGLNCLAAMPAAGQYAAIVLAVSHHQFLALGEAGIKALGQPGAVLFDVKSILPLGAADGRL